MGLINEYANFLKNIPQSLNGFYHQVGNSLYGSPNNTSEEQKEATTLRLRLSIQDARNAHNKWLASLDRISQTGSRPVGNKINRDFDTYITNLKKYPEENTKINVSGSGSSSSNSWDSRYNDVLNNLTQEQQYYLDSKGINFQTARGLQEGLNKNFNSGLVVDNKWGSKSQAALDKILAEMPQMSKEDNEKYRPSATGVINQNDLLQEQISPFARISNPILLNRSDTRSILRNYGYNPYSFTGSQRKALRKYLNGDYSQKIDFIDRNSDLFKELIAPFVTFLKKGGLLVSNNPVERFKVKKGLNGFQITYKPLVAANSFFDDSKKKLKSEIESKMSEAQARNDRLESSHRKANKNNLAPRKANNTAYLLDLLYKIGAFGNIDYNKAVDGIIGPKTRAAIAKAEQIGYDIDLETGKVRKFEKNLNAITKHKTDYNILEPYIVIDKKNKKMFRMQKDKVLDEYEVTTGLLRGDGWYPLKGHEYLHQQPRTTGAGIFTINAKSTSHYPRDRENKEPIFFLNAGDKNTTMAIHEPVNEYRRRLFNNGTLNDNCTSYGCISIPSGEVRKLYDNKLVLTGDSVYILPEIDGNYIYDDNGKLTTHFGKNNPTTYKTPSGFKGTFNYNNII